MQRPISSLLKQTVLFILFLQVLQGCVSTPENQVNDAKLALEDALTHNRFVSYRNIAVFPGQVVCGEYEAQDRWGGNAGYHKFAVVDGKPYTLIDAYGYAVFCSDNPAAGLSSSLGIGPLDESNPDLLTAYRDMTSIVTALTAFESTNGFYPSTEEGLALLTGSVEGRRTASVPEGGYLKPVPSDPWGNPYRYYSEPFAGVKGSFDLWTLGADNAEGGTGANADIRHEYLKYLDHVSSLR